ncbi:pyruvate dehydrogenase (acetyl-transferring) E1 component subunit alpha [Ketobacter alkanivorans]|uniref:Pyruvate dehydrogenase E1 component subunit alpha n=1 Tax=Ketobacter alkanivorans TaxID=1917421 RepID=A0A2K9LHM1_9GAMM|nr:pyruvate dehydrogenase (acetyl-transferring) E1 component subunit alpha [Ketobacter alkanivorans]AUM11763.1 pyruvate dehydrogenase (acetyl-transferring) E1 component subunit alpha [Ketobacter alkanivorans]
MQYTTTPYQQKQFINEEGLCVTPLTSHLNNAMLLESYRAMVMIRTFDQRVVALQRTGQMGTYASCLGQEAIGAGIGLALGAEDVFLPYYRDQATQYLRGVPLEQQMQYWGGNEWGNHFTGVAAQDFPNCVPIATQVTHAAGVASAIKIRGEKRCALVTCGDGATSRGDFYEAMNLAGVWQLPMIMVVNNNQWAISVPRQIQTGATTIAQKAVAAGIEGFQVDGNDVCAVYDAVHYAVKKAHCGKGSTLIEAVSYRLGDHTTADDATRYRSHEEVNEAWKREPIKRLQTCLHQKGLWSENQEQALLSECKQEVEQSVQAYLKHEEQPVSDLFDYLFEETPSHLVTQKEHVLKKWSMLGGK